MLLCNLLFQKGSFLTLVDFSFSFFSFPIFSHITYAAVCKSSFTSVISRVDTVFNTVFINRICESRFDHKISTLSFLPLVCFLVHQVLSRQELRQGDCEALILCIYRDLYFYYTLINHTSDQIFLLSTYNIMGSIFDQIVPHANLIVFKSILLLICLLTFSFISFISASVSQPFGLVSPDHKVFVQKHSLTLHVPQSYSSRYHSNASYNSFYLVHSYKST